MFSEKPPIMPMHRLAQVTLIAVFAAMMPALSAQEPARQISFTDNFTPAPSFLWNGNNGFWASTAGRYYAQVPNDDPLTYTALPFVLTDYTLTVTTVVGDGGIWVRSDQDNPYGHYILLVIGGDNYGQGARGGEAGTSLYFATAAGSGINEVQNVFKPGETYKITVIAKGSRYSVYINDSPLPVDTFVDDTFLYGQVGLYDDQPNTITGYGFGALTTFTNFRLSGTAVPPSVELFTPESGNVGAGVKLRGRNLQLATAVSFNGVPAKFFQDYPGTEIVATVPASATTGPIEIVTPIGTAISRTDFIVTGP